MFNFGFWMGEGGSGRIRLRASRLPPSFACGVASWRDKGGRRDFFIAAPLLRTDPRRVVRLLTARVVPASERVRVSWLTLNPEVSVIRFLEVAGNGGAMHPTIFRRLGLRRHG